MQLEMIARLPPRSRYRLIASRMVRRFVRPAEHIQPSYCSTARFSQMPLCHAPTTMGGPGTAVGHGLRNASPTRSPRHSALIISRSDLSCRNRASKSRPSAA